MLTKTTTLLMCMLLVGLSLFVATILSRAWMRYTALGCAAVETALIIALVAI